MYTINPIFLAYPVFLSWFTVHLFSFLWGQSLNPNQPACLDLSLALVTWLFIHNQKLNSISQPNLSIFYFLKASVIRMCPSEGTAIVSNITQAEACFAFLSLLLYSKFLTFPFRDFPKASIPSSPIPQLPMQLYLSFQRQTYPTSSWMSLWLIVSINSAPLL